MESLTLEEQATNYETVKHIRTVQRNLNKVIRELLTRGEIHDESKLHSPEVEAFTQVTKDLHGLEYNSPEYKENIKKLGPALEHHYAKNRHHIDHWKNGINDMDIIDMIEMFCDWQAATERHATGNLNKSIDINAERYNINPQLVQIFKNSIDVLERRN